MESFCVKLIQGPPSRNAVAVTSTISPTCYYLVILFPAYTWAEEFRPDIWLEVYRREQTLALGPPMYMNTEV